MKALWWPNWYVTRLHAVKEQGGGRQALCGTWTRAPESVHLDWQKKKLDEGPPKCKHCLRQLEKREERDVPLLEPKDVQARVEEIRKMTSDPEAAHIAEDFLHREVLAFIARNRFGYASDLAQEALATIKIEFPRWTA